MPARSVCPNVSNERPHRIDIGPSGPEASLVKTDGPGRQVPFLLLEEHHRQIGTLLTQQPPLDLIPNKIKKITYLPIHLLPTVAPGSPTPGIYTRKEKRRQTIVRRQTQGRTVARYRKNALIVLIKPKGLIHIAEKKRRLNSSHVRISYAVFCLKKK